MLEDTKENQPPPPPAPMSPAKSRCSTPGSTGGSSCMSPTRPPPETTSSNHSSPAMSPKSSEQSSPIRTTNFSISSILGKPREIVPQHADEHRPPTSPKSTSSRSPSPQNIHPKPHEFPLKSPFALPPMLHPGYAGYFFDKALPAHLAWYPWLGMAAAAAAGGGTGGAGGLPAAAHPYMAHLGQQLGFAGLTAAAAAAEHNKAPPTGPRPSSPLHGVGERLPPSAHFPGLHHPHRGPGDLHHPHHHHHRPRPYSPPSHLPHHSSIPPAPISSSTPTPSATSTATSPASRSHPDGPQQHPHHITIAPNHHHHNGDDDDDNEMVEIEAEISDSEDADCSLDASGNTRPLSDADKANLQRKKKTRTVFSRSQIFQLETMFDMKRYLSSSERSGLAKSLNMTETQVKIWFQNRRNKWKRQLAAEMEAANMAQVHGQRLVRVPILYHEAAGGGPNMSSSVSTCHSSMVQENSLLYSRPNHHPSLNPAVSASQQLMPHSLYPHVPPNLRASLPSIV